MMMRLNGGLTLEKLKWLLKWWFDLGKIEMAP